MARNKKLGILTGGGDVPGLNPAIKAVVETAIDHGWDVIGVRRGWGGLLHCNLDSPQARKNLFPLIEKVNADRTAVEITSKAGRAILMSADDWEAWQETAYLFRSPANARRLLDAADALDAGNGIRTELRDYDAPREKGKRLFPVGSGAGEQYRCPAVSTPAGRPDAGDSTGVRQCAVLHGQ